jgi:DNA-directed RNA polymerase specialized sigma24 family protein
MGDHATDPATATFVTHRNLLFTVAYEMLGSAADAEDVLQETWLRWVEVDEEHVRDRRAYLVRITIRQALNRLRTRPGPRSPCDDLVAQRPRGAPRGGVTRAGRCVRMARVRTRGAWTGEPTRGPTR